MKKQKLVPVFGVAAVGLFLLTSPGHSSSRQNPRQSASTEVRPFITADEPDGQEMEIFLDGGGSWLGVEAKEVTAENVQQLKLSAERGALVGKIVPDSPAAKAGLKENDVITEINGQRVEGIAQFRRMIREIPAGRTVQLTIQRDGRAQSLGATLGKSESRRTLDNIRGSSPGAFTFRMPDAMEMPEVMELGNLNNFSFSGPGQPRLGMDAEDLQGDLGNYFGAPEGQGVLVRSVHPDSPASRAGLKSGDVITSMNGQRVRNIHELREQLRGEKDEKTLKVGLLRNKTDLSLSVTLPATPKREIHKQTEHSSM